MSFYDDASFLLIPSGIKEDVVFAQKPTSGLGDLTFTRASDATYTDSTGVVRRSPYNLVTFSEMFTDASWSKIAAGTGVAPSITANTSTSPTGTLTADRVQFNCTGTTFSDRSILFQTITSAVVGRSYVFTIYIKANAPSEVGKQLRFNVDNGTNPAQVITITSDWTRYTFAAIATSTSINALLETRGTVTTNTTADVLLWGAQLVEGTAALDYFPTTNRQDVPRIDFRNADGTLSSCGRLLLEPQRTNSIRNSSMVGAVAGTPGTAPTNWGVASAGLTQTVVGIGTESGLPYVDLRFNGTAGSSIVRINSETSQQIAATNGQTWASSCYIKRISGTFDGSNFGFIMRSSAGAPLGTLFNSPTITTNLLRFVFAGTTNNASTAFVQPTVDFNVTVGQTYDFTIRIAAPQMELGAYATTWVPTTTAAVTRMADTASKTGVSSIIGQSAGTIFWDVNDVTGTPANTGNPDFGIRNTAFTNWIGITTNSFALPFRVVVRPTSGSIINYEANITRAKAAVAWSSAGAVLYVNGAQVATSAVNPNFSFDRIDMLGGIISYKTNQAALFTTRLTNAQMQELTTL